MLGRQVVRESRLLEGEIYNTCPRQLDRGFLEA